MTTAPRIGIGLLAFAACLAAGCSPGGLKQDVEFLRGCWVWKDLPGGPAQGFLRLLPPEPGATTLDGQVQMVAGAEPQARSRFSFARDGSSVTWTAMLERVPSGVYLGVTPEEPPSPGYSQALFRQQGAGYAILQVEHHDDRLSIFATDLRTDRSVIEFLGERDGCD